MESNRPLDQQSKPKDPTPKPPKKRPLQVTVSEELFDEFSRLAGEEFGFRKGSKSLFFEKLLTQYKKTK